jgi:hypothetical protein
MSKSEDVMSAIQGILSEKVSESAQVINEGSGDLKDTARQAFDMSQKIWDKAFKSEMEAGLKALGFVRKSFDTDYKDASFELSYTNKKVDSKITISGAFFGGSSASHYFYVEVFVDNKLVEKREVEYFDSIIDMAQKALDQGSK